MILLTRLWAGHHGAAPAWNHGSGLAYDYLSLFQPSPSPLHRFAPALNTDAAVEGSQRYACLAERTGGACSKSVSRGASSWPIGRIWRPRRPPRDDRAENSHLPIRRRERKQQKFGSTASAQRFLATHAAVYNVFNLQPHLIRRPTLGRVEANPASGSPPPPRRSPWTNHGVRETKVRDHMRHGHARASINQERAAGARRSPASPVPSAAA